MNWLLLKLKRELKIRNFSKQTLKGYLYSVEKFLEYSDNNGLNENSVKDYVQKGLKIKNPSSIQKDLFAIKFFFENVLRQKIKIPNPKKNQTLPEILTIKEVCQMIETISNIKHKLIIKLLYGCGLRVNEIVHLQNKDVIFKEDLIHIKLVKGKKDRFVKIPSSIKKELKNYSELNKNKFLFPSNRSGKLTKDTIQKIVQNSAKRAGIEKRVYPHFLRHSFATHLLKQAINHRRFKEQQKLLGHSDIKTTQIYTQISQASIKNIESPLDRICI